jgi:hypothetical protein
MLPDCALICAPARSGIPESTSTAKSQFDAEQQRTERVGVVACFGGEKRGRRAAFGRGA